MPDVYCSSTAYAAVPQWAATTAYTVGQFVRALATPANFFGYYVHRCTTAGTTAGTEPVWSTALNGTTTSNTAVFTNVTGSSTYGWSAAAGTLYTFANAGTATFNRVAGDRIFISSDHAETTAVSAITYAFGAAAFGNIQIISVNRAGSVPPVAADETSGAAITHTGTGAAGFILDALTAVHWQGLTMTTASTNGIYFGNSSSSTKGQYFKNCALIVTNATSGSRFTCNEPGEVVLDNTTVKFGATTQTIGPGGQSLHLKWINTPAAIQGATLPATLFTPGSGSYWLVTARGVDLSAVTGTLVTSNTTGPFKILLDSCRIASAVTRYATPAAGAMGFDETELVNCYDGTNQLNERYTAAGALTVERSTTMTGGASDTVGAFSFKLVSSTRSDHTGRPLQSFVFDADNTVTGSARTATVEIISSASLNNNDVYLTLQYMGTSGSTIASGLNSWTTKLTPAAALPTSSVTWVNPPGTPVKQYLRVTFTPQTAGRVRGQVHLGKVSTTIWVNPQLTLA